VLPLANTLECIELTRRTSSGQRQACGQRAREIIPYIRLREHFNIRTERPEIEQIMVVETERGRFGFVVDQVLGDCQTVIKNLGRFYRHVQGLRRHHSGQRNGGADSRSGAAGAGRGALAIPVAARSARDPAERMQPQKLCTDRGPELRRCWANASACQ
jgi:hypothetical protein